MSMSITMTPGMTETARIKQLTLPASTITFEQLEYSNSLQESITTLVHNHLRRAHDVYTSDCNCPDCRGQLAINDSFTWETTGTKLHKRIKRHVYTRFNINLSDDFLRSLADLAAAERNSISRTMDATTEFTWRPGDFGDPKSCFFNQYRLARLRWLPRLGTSAVRTFDGSRGDGRYWIFPLPILNEKYRAEPLYVGFNGYGTLKNSRELYLASMVKAAGDKWNRTFATTTINLSMDEVYVNGDQRCTLVHPADMDVVDFARKIFGDNRYTNEPLQASRYESMLTVGIGEGMYSRVGLPLPAWSKWADGRYCESCDLWDYIEHIRFRARRPYCSRCWNERWTPEDDPQTPA